MRQAGVFVSGAAQAARFYEGNTGRLAPCRYKVLTPARSPGIACRMWLALGLCLAVWLSPRGVPAAEPESAPLRMIDVTAASGITFRHTDGGSGRRYIVESVVAGLALFDYDADGWIDIYFTNGAALQGTTVDRPPQNALYRNQGDWTFREVTEAAGVGDRGYGLGVTVGDYDHDGFPDLYLSNFGPNVLYRNNGDGTFSDATQLAGVDRGEKVGAGTCFLDMDADGDLDLYAANYVDFHYDNHVIRMIGPHQFHPGPNDYRGVPDNLFRNDGDGTFTDVSDASGIAAVAGPGMGMVCLDFDDDGDTDVFVGNDAAANFLFQNDGRGKFDEVGLLAGVAYDGLGNANSSMGTDCGDYDNDGQPDMFMTDYSNEPPVLYRNLGQGLFDDVTNLTGAGRSAFPHVTWGNGLVDLDNDGDRDLFIACGHLLDNIHFIDDRTSFKVRNILLMNQQARSFTDVSDRCGSGLEPVESSRGAGFDDLDNDGDVDVVVLNANAAPTIIRNETATGNSWLQLQLRGVHSNRDGVGARVRVVAGDLVQVAEVHSGRSYQSHFGSQLHFGLGTRSRVDRVEVRWIGGDEEVWTNVAANQSVVVRQGGAATRISIPGR